MKKFLKKIQDIWSHEELRRKIIFTLLLLLAYRVGSYIVLPGVDSSKLDTGAQAGSIAGLLGLFTGGAFSRASIFALGIMPYISASIIIQLLGALFNCLVWQFLPLPKCKEKVRVVVKKSINGRAS